MNRARSVCAAILLWVIALLILVACVRPQNGDDSAELELEEVAVFLPTEQPTQTPAPTKVSPLPTAEIQEPTQEANVNPAETPSGQPEPGPTPLTASIVITAPANGSTLDIVDPIHLEGTGSGLPEGNVALKILDAGGALIAETAATLVGDEVGMGGAGKWQATLFVAQYPGKHGSIVAFSPSPVDGSVMVEDSVQVFFIESPRIPFVEIHVPAAGDQLEEGPVTVSGVGGGLFEGSVVIQVEDAGGNILVVQPLILQGDNVGVGGTGSWETIINLSLLPGSPLKIIAFSTSPEDGAVMVSASVEVIYGATRNTVIHVVQSGETMFRISQRYGVPVADILAANNLTDPDYIAAGQQLIIPLP